MFTFNLLVELGLISRKGQKPEEQKRDDKIKIKSYFLLLWQNEIIKWAESSH